MINILVMSKDILFAKMLKNEIEGIGREYSAFVNSSEAFSHADIAVIDLDSGYSEPDMPECTLIGFSVKENEASRELCDKCAFVLHRPFSIEAFLGYVEDLSLGREASPAPLPRQSAPEAERLLLDEGGECAYLDGKKIHLSGNEYAILRRLYESKGEAVGRDELAGVLSSSGGNMCDVYVCHLRTKLEEGRSERFIFTVRGKGYALKLR